MIKFNILIFVFTISSLNNVNSWKVTLFDQANFKGANVVAEGDQNDCVSLKQSFNDRASSANTHNTCVRLYEHDNCNGKSIILRPGSSSHNNLSSLGFDNRASSVHSCSEDSAVPPPAHWKEHWFEHKQVVNRVYYDNDLAVYFDNDVDKSIIWMNTFLHDVWVYTKKVYGHFGTDPRLFAIFHSGKYSGGHPSTYFDENHDYRNVIDCGSGDPNAWKSGAGNDLDLTTHEVSHIVEGASHGVHGSPAFRLWGDSKWAEIFIYDVYLGINRTADVKRWHDMQMNNPANIPRPNSYWFRDWFLPIYENYGRSRVLNSFFQLLSQHFPKNNSASKNRPQYTRDMNYGEFFHFWSGAARTNLKNLATKAFGWSDDYEKEFKQARTDFPNIRY